MTDLLAAAGWGEGALAKVRDPWFVVGMAGQITFAARFLVQWLASEREKRVVIPVAFWWLSIAGGAVTLVYAVHIEDPVFMLAQAAGLAMYARNLVIHSRHAGAGGP
jgi:lipid-A-disaccharide synthase-like uncharacterized protein